MPVSLEIWFELHSGPRNPNPDPLAHRRTTPLTEGSVTGTAALPPAPPAALPLDVAPARDAARAAPRTRRRTE